MITHRRTGRARPAGRRPSTREPTVADLPDANIVAAGLLFEMAAVQPSEGSRFGYKRAAKAIVELPASVIQLVESGALEDVSLIGPGSTRVLTEFVTLGHSPTVDAAVAASRRRDEVAAGRALRANFLSQHATDHALSMRLPASVVRPRLVRGDLQMHSTWSDGVASVKAMAEACLALGHGCMGMTDHSYGLAVAGGMSMESAIAQGQEIDRLNDEYRGRFRIFRGVEANIRADGTLDLQRDEMQAFEYVMASPHALLRRAEDQTARMLAAVRTRGVAMLGHPRGRMFNRRAGVRANWARVFDAAAERQVAIELDGNWHRQDLDWELASQALEAGCIFTLNSDAHSTAELRFTQYAIAHARIARIPAERVINCWPDDRIEDWMRERRAPRG